MWLRFTLSHLIVQREYCKVIRIQTIIQESNKSWFPLHTFHCCTFITWKFNTVMHEITLELPPVFVLKIWSNLWLILRDLDIGIKTTFQNIWMWLWSLIQQIFSPTWHIVMISGRIIASVTPFQIKFQVCGSCFELDSNHDEQYGKMMTKIRYN